jgi:hypothetical protein
MIRANINLYYHEHVRMEKSLLAGNPKVLSYARMCRFTAPRSAGFLSDIYKLILAKKMLK